MLNRVPQVLIVDDSLINTRLVESVLGAEGFRTLSATNGGEGRELCRTAQPDLVLLDVVMPGESGFDTCAKLKSDPVTADIPIIFLSALDDPADKVRGLKAGGVDYVAKPMHREEVLARVRVHLRISENNRRIVREQQARIEQFRDAQQSILVRPENNPNAAFEVFYQPLEGAGGDFYDVVSVDSDVYGYFVADVSGHGVSAAFLTSAIKALLRQYTGPMFSPEDTMRGVNAVMRQMLTEEQYLTACYVHLNRRTGKVSVVSAAHPPLILVRASGEMQIVEMDGEPLGVFGSVVLQRVDLRVGRGDRFFLYTDGMTESQPGAPRSSGLQKLNQLCVSHRMLALKDAVKAIADDIQSSRPNIEDDLLLLAVEVT